MSETTEPLQPLDSEQAWQARAARREEMRRQQQEQKKQQKAILFGLIIVLAACILLAGILIRGCSSAPAQVGENPSAASTQTPTTLPPETEPPTLPPVTWMTFEENRPLTARQYFVYDVDAGKYVTISGRATDIIYPASVTKLFTAYVALQHIDLNAEITAGSALTLVDPESSIAGIKSGDKLKAETLVEAMLLPSGNDAACILAVEVGRILAADPELEARAAADLFIKEMNDQARQLGMMNSHFTNPDGIHNDAHYTSFADLVTLGKLVLENETITKYAGVAKDSIPLAEDRTLEWKNTNATINPASDYYCPYSIGLKTGQTSQAGSCLLSAFRCNGRTLLIGIFGCPEKNGRFPDTLQLFNEAMGFPYAEPATEPPTEAPTAAPTQPDAATESGT